MAPTTTLPPGFRFHPTDEELVAYYLDRKISGRTIDLEIIPEIDLYKCEPWELPEKSYLPSKDMEWYFYSPRDRKYPNGSRTNRATGAGYWKATGKDRQVNSNKIPVGMKKTLVYYKGRAPHGMRTNWVMHEYRLIHSVSGTSSSSTSSLKDSYALCRVFKKTALQMAKSKREDAVSSDLKDQDGLLGDDDNGLEISRSGTENEQDSSILGFAKLPISDASSSEVTQGTTLETTTTKGCLQASYLAADEANSVSDFYFLGVDCSSNLIQDLQTPHYASLQNQLPYSPLELEDFPDHDQTIEEYTSYDKLRDYMNGTIEEIFSLCSSQDNSSSQLPLQHY